MAAKINKLESSLVSMTGTLIYLNDMLRTLKKKPIIPLSVKHIMAETQGQLDVLNEQLLAAQASACKEAQPLLTEWLAQLGLAVGGRFTFRAGAGRWGRYL